MSRAEGKVVVVTGAAGGQGAAEAIALAREGATVIATDLHEEDPQLGAGIAYRRLDVSRAGGLAGARHVADRRRTAASTAWSTTPASRSASRLEEIELADWNRVIGINLTGALLGIQTVAPLMPAGGSIVNVSSIAGLSGHFAVAYTVSKWGLRGLSRVASLELGARGIRVNTVLPGFIETPMTASAPAWFRSGEHRADAARPHGRGRRGRAARRLPDLGRVVVHQRRGDRRRRRTDRARRHQALLRHRPLFQ